MFNLFRKKSEENPSTTAADTTAPVPEAATEAAAGLSWAQRLKASLAKTRDKLGKNLAGLFGGGKIDDDLYEELETVLLTADMGVDATLHLLGDVRERVSLGGLKDASELRGALRDSLNDLIQPLEVPLEIGSHRPFILMVAGVNGAGKRAWRTILVAKKDSTWRPNKAMAGMKAYRPKTSWRA